MIRKYDRADIAKLLHLEHDIEEMLSIDKGTWVQSLMEEVDNPDYFICGTGNGYIVAFYDPHPLARRIWVVYSWTAGLEDNKKILEMLIEWGRAKGATVIEFTTTNVAGHMVYGFRKKATLMSMEI